ncbi:MAG: hypothetical protein BGO77_03830 [Caedibacter sp. 37-49]|nr:MAG: hypothetical protein BGO77_03830 [Caedibacter sp. 37-49]
MSFLHNITVWHWWILGIIFLILELVVPGASFVWLAIATGLVGLILLAFPSLGLGYQLLLFSFLSILSVILYLRLRSKPKNASNLNRRAEQYIGHVFVLEKALKNGQGKVQLGDTIWTIEGPNCAQGTTVKVISAKESTLKVEVL